MNIERVYIPCCRTDLRLTAICAASIRYWHSDIPIFLIKDLSHGTFDTAEMEQLCGVQVLQTEKTHFGWGFAKLEPLFEEEPRRFLVVDSDTVFTGPVLDELNRHDTDFIVDDETPPPDEVRRHYFDLMKLRELDPSFQFSGKTFNSGQWVGTSGLISPIDFELVVDWTSPPTLKYPQHFMPGDQGVLNYVLSRLEQDGAVSLSRVPLMLWAPCYIQCLDLSLLKEDSPYRQIIHWAGCKKNRLGGMPRSDILCFFEQCYFSGMAMGTLRKHWRSSTHHFADLSQRAVRKAAHLIVRHDREVVTKVSVARGIARGLFGLSCLLGKPVGGIRPHRLVHYLARYGYGGADPSPDQFRWVRDNFGSEYLVHPYYLIDRQIMAFGSYEVPLHSYIDSRVRGGMTCVDVGANAGAISLHLGRRVGVDGRVICFEPVPLVADRLRKNVARNDMQGFVEVHEVALCDSAGYQSMALAPTIHTNQGMSSLVEFDHGDLTEQTTVACDTLDGFVRDNGIASIDLIKVDIQGAEPLFLAGAQRTLADLKPELIMEIASSSLSEAGLSGRGLLFELATMGYRTFELKGTGEIGDEIIPDRCDDSFTADSVICRKAG